MDEVPRHYHMSLQYQTLPELMNTQTRAALFASTRAGAPLMVAPAPPPQQPPPPLETMQLAAFAVARALAGKEQWVHAEAARRRFLQEMQHLPSRFGVPLDQAVGTLWFWDETHAETMVLHFGLNSVMSITISVVFGLSFYSLALHFLFGRLPACSRGPRPERRLRSGGVWE